MDREGTTTPLRDTLVNWSNLQFAPDGRRLAMQIAAPGPSDIWVYEWARETITRLTSDPAFDSKPVWTPDGRRIAFASARGDKSTLNLYWHAVGWNRRHRAAHGKHARTASRLVASQRQAPRVRREQPDHELGPDGPADGRRCSVRVEAWHTHGILATPSAEREPMFSPDGRWLAYHSNESGRNEVYVRPFPGPGGKWQISSGGGTYPTWSRTKPELLYSVNGQIMVAPFSVQGDSFLATKPRRWSDGRYLERPGNRGFDLHPDGERLAVAFAPAAQTPRDAKQDKVVFIFNFFDELRQIAPATRR